MWWGRLPTTSASTGLLWTTFAHRQPGDGKFVQRPTRTNRITARSRPGALRWVRLAGTPMSLGAQGGVGPEAARGRRWRGSADDAPPPSTGSKACPGYTLAQSQDDDAFSPRQEQEGGPTLKTLLTPLAG